MERAIEYSSESRDGAEALATAEFLAAQEGIGAVTIRNFSGLTWRVCGYELLTAGAPDPEWMPSWVRLIVCPQGWARRVGLVRP